MAPNYSTDPNSSSGSKRTKYDIKDYSHDTGTLRIQAKELYEAAKSVDKEQKNIRRKLKKERSKQLDGCVDKYNVAVTDIRNAVERIESIVDEDKGEPESNQIQSRGGPTRGASSVKETRTKRRQNVQEDVFRGGYQSECFQCLHKDSKITQLQDTITKLRNDLDRNRREHEDNLDQILRSNEERERNLERKYQEEVIAKEEALRRLSSMASSKLRDNNPNITDLSDQNRPTKIAEKLSELYDNQWTDAFDILEREMKDGQVIQTLLNTLMSVYHECRRLTGNESTFFERVQRCIILPPEAGSVARTDILLPDQLKQQLKEFRKVRARIFVKEIAKVVTPRIPLSKHRATEIQEYISHCVEIGWLCAVQDPPLVLSAQSPQVFDTNLFKDYTKRGKYVDYVVWPALFLSKGGALLSKGVAQGTDHGQGREHAQGTDHKQSRGHEQTAMETYSRDRQPTQAYNVPVQEASAGIRPDNQYGQRVQPGPLQGQHTQIRHFQGQHFTTTIRVPDYTQNPQVFYPVSRTKNPSYDRYADGARVGSHSTDL